MVFGVTEGPCLLVGGTGTGRGATVPEFSLTGRNAVVTGANSGVGRAATELLLAAGANVTLVCRDRGRGERALAEVIRDGASATASLEVADLASVDAVRTLAVRLAEQLERIDILVNNASVWRNRLELTADGFERTFATNHLGHFVLTNLLLPRLSGGGQIVNVSSEAHRSGDLRRAELEQIARGKAWRAGGFPAYADAKLANVLFTVESVRRWQEHDLTINALHPGVLATGFWNQNSGAVAAMLRLLKVFLRNPEVGGSAVLSVLETASQRCLTGRYFRVTAECAPQPQAADEALAHTLWESSVVWGNLARVCRISLRDNPSCRFYAALGGTPVRNRTISIGGADLPEVAYGWNDLALLGRNLRRREGV